MSFVAVPNYRRNYWSGPANFQLNDQNTVNPYAYFAYNSEVRRSTLEAGGTIVHSSFSNITAHQFSKFHQSLDGTLYAYGDGPSPDTYAYFTTTTPVSKYNSSTGQWALLPAFPEQVRIQSLCDWYPKLEGFTQSNTLLAVATPTTTVANSNTSDIVYVYKFDGTSWTKGSALPVGCRNGKLFLYITPEYYSEYGGTSSWNHFYHSQSAGLLSSANAFDSWTTSSTANGGYGSIVQFENQIVRSITNGIEYSTNAGGSWTQVIFPGGSWDIRDIAFSTSTGNYIAIHYGLAGLGEGANIWYANKNNLSTWTKFTNLGDMASISTLWSCGHVGNKFVVTTLAQDYIFTIADSLTSAPVNYANFSNYGKKGQFQQRLKQSRHYYGEAARTISSSYATYPRDIQPYTSWEKVNFTALAAGSTDDGYYTDNISIGFNWGYNGSTYNTFKLNTNGMMQFTNFNSKIQTWDGTDVGILGYYGDLRFSAENQADHSSYTIQRLFGIGSSTSLNSIGPRTFTLNELATLSNFAEYPNCPGFSISPGIDYLTISNPLFFSAPVLMTITGYTKGGVNYSILKSVYLIPGWPVQVPEIAGTNVTHLTVQIWRIPIPQYIANQGHSAWKKTISWVDNGVTHNIFRFHVNCTAYTSGYNRSYIGYTISLYKAGSIQYITTRLSPYSGLLVDVNSPGNKKLGPWPAIASNSNIGGFHSYNETSWVSYDNGVTWSTQKPNNTVVHTGPAPFTLGTTTNVSLETLKRSYQQGNYDPNFVGPPAPGQEVRVTDYAPTQPVRAKFSYGYGIDQFGFDADYYVGSAMSSYILKHVVGLLASSADPNEQLLANIFDTYYEVTGKNGSSYYRYGDINQDGNILSNDALDAAKIYSGESPNDSDSPSGLQKLVSRIVEYETGTPSFVDWAIRNSIISGPSASFSDIYNIFPPGIITNNSLLQNVGISSLSELGPLSKQNIVQTYPSSTAPLFSWNNYPSLGPDNADVPEKTAFVLRHYLF